MKRYLLLCISICITLTSIAAPWDLSIKPRTLPNIITQAAYVWNAQYTPSGFKELIPVVVLDANTGNYTSRVTYSIYGYYKHTQLGWPQVYWQWGYKEFTIDIPPNSYESSTSYVMHTGELFNMSGVSTSNGQGEWIQYSSITLVSFTQM